MGKSLIGVSETQITNLIFLKKIELLKNILEPELFDAEKSKAIYKKTDRLVEKISAIGYFVMAKLTPILWIWPRVIISYFVYFTTDLGNESFDLPLLMV